MAIIRRVNQLSQMREEVSDMRAIESAASADFDLVAEALISGPDTPYIINGFAINMSAAPITGAASNLQVIVANSSLLHTTASQSGTFFLVPTGTPNVTLNAATVANVIGSFVPNANNYVGIDYYRFQDATTDTQRYFWDPTSDEEDEGIAPAAITMNYKFVITATLWATNVLPLAIIQTDSSNNVVSITDSRPLLLRLGTGGASPNPFHTFPWPEGQTENNTTTTSNSSNPFFGGDKGITDLKDWMDAVMTQLLGLNGGPYWYSFTSSNVGSVPLLREDATATVMTGTGAITHSATTAGLINWSSPINLKIIGANLSYQIATNPSGTTVTLSDNEVAYIELTRDVPVAPNLIWTNSSAVVTSVGNVAWTSGLYSVTANGFGDWIRLASSTHAGYYQIQTINSSSQVTLTQVFTGSSTSSSGAPSLYAYGSYTLPGVTGGLRDIQLAGRGAVPISPSTFWLFVREDDGGAIPRVYVKWLGTDLQQGDSEEISGPQLQNVLTYVGSQIESSTTPFYVSAYNIYEGNGPTVSKQVTDVTTGDASTLTSDQYFLIYSAGGREYYVWVNKDGTGINPMPVANATGIEWDVATGQTSTQTAAALVTALNGTFFKDFTATNIANAVTITNNSAGTTFSPADFNIGPPFAIFVSTSGTGVGNFIIQDGDNLTLAIKKLDQEISSIIESLDNPTYDEVVEIVASGATPPTSITGPVTPGTNIFLPNNTRESNAVQYYTVGKGTLQVFLNGQFLDLESGAYTEVGTLDAPSNEIQIHYGLVVGDELELRLSGGGGGAGGGGTPGPQGPPGVAGPTGAPGFNAAGGPVPVSVKTSSYSVLTTDCFLAADATTGTLTFTLPTASGNTGRIFYMKKIDSSANAMVIQGNGGDLIDGLSTVSTMVQYESFSIISTGTGWYLF